MIQVMGLNGLIADLIKAGLTVAARVDDESAEVAEAVAETMRSNAPVLSGSLRDSIEVERVGGGWEIGPTVDYAHFPEYGTAHMPPEPYAGPAADAHEGAYVEAVGKAGADF